MSSKERLHDLFVAAERAGVSYWTFYRGAQAGLFKTVYLGGRRMIAESTLNYIIEHGFGPQYGPGRRRKQPKKAEAAAAE